MDKGRMTELQFLSCFTMKKSMILILIAVVFSCLTANAQTKEDSLAIEKACRN
jgi:hypothetical protein